MPLKQTFIGVTEHRRLKQMQKLDELAYDVALAAVDGGHQVMIFVHSRRETAKTAQMMREPASNPFSISDLSIQVPEHRTQSLIVSFLATNQSQTPLYQFLNLKNVPKTVTCALSQNFRKEEPQGSQAGPVRQVGARERVFGRRPRRAQTFQASAGQVPARRDARTRMTFRASHDRALLDFSNSQSWAW